MPSTQIYYYQTPSGNNPFSEFLDSLNPKQQSKILRILEQIKEYGLISAIPHTKKLTGTPLWEIRTLGKDNIRSIYAIPYQNSIIILHGFIKKTQKTPSKEIQTALKRYYDWQSHN